MYWATCAREAFDNVYNCIRAHKRLICPRVLVIGMILGISASGRVVDRDDHGRLLKGVTEDLVKFILDNTGEECEYVSLSGKDIVGCQGCLRCASDNVCKVVDDWAEIRDLMLAWRPSSSGPPTTTGQSTPLATRSWRGSSA